MTTVFRSPSDETQTFAAAVRWRQTEEKARTCQRVVVGQISLIADQWIFGLSSPFVKNIHIYENQKL
jgi:hypothetical protein